jgi:hypothetical protein
MPWAGKTRKFGIHRCRESKKCFFHWHCLQSPATKERVTEMQLERKEKANSNTLQMHNKKDITHQLLLRKRPNTISEDPESARLTV